MRRNTHDTTRIRWWAVSEWQTVKLGDLCHSITDGKHGDCENQDHSGYYFLSAKDIKDGRLNYDNARQITESDFWDTHKRTRLEPLDILITNSGSIGRMALVSFSDLTSKTTFQKSVAILKPNQSKVFPHWLFYYLNSEIERLIGYAGGTAQKNLLLRDLRAFTVTIPPLETQRRIAAILSAYDDLVENNTRRIQALEQAAHDLYREWFVHFRFPGHESVPLVDSGTEYGMIPQGWEVVRLKDLTLNIISGGTPSTTNESYWNGSIPWLSSGETRNNLIISTEKTITELGVKESSARFVPRLSIVIASAGQGKTRGQTSLLMIDTYVNQSVLAIICDFDIATPLYVFMNLKGRYDELRGISDAASSRGSLTKQILNELLLLKPVRELLNEFDIVMMPMYEQIYNLMRKNNALREARDLLLPRLVSGQLDVREIEVEMGPLFFQ